MMMTCVYARRHLRAHMLHMHTILSCLTLQSNTPFLQAERTHIYLRNVHLHLVRCLDEQTAYISLPSNTCMGVQVGHSEPHCHPDVRRIIANRTQEVDHFSKEIYHIRTVYNVCVVSRIYSRHAGPPPGSEYDGIGCCFLDTAGFLITAHMCLGRHSPGCGPSKI